MSLSRNSKWLWLLLAGLTLICCGVGQGHAATVFSAVDDFSSSSNPTPPWSYLYDNGAGPQLLTVTPTGMPAGLSGWWNGIALPNAVSVFKNNTGAPLTYNGGNTVQPSDVLYVDPENYSAIVRWTAPSAGMWSIGGRFEGIDVPPHSPKLEILENSTTVLLGPTTVSSYGQVVPFGNTLDLQPGDTIDFIVALPASGDYTFLGTGLAANISLVQGDIPEPSALLIWSLLGGVGIALGCWRRKRAA